mgnify:CR=1 FL=1|tara:strand:- start:10 stop:693 length:684 start_codon:yes stop_codon:yes gene_type:complete
MVSGISNNIKELFKNPLTLWFQWFVKSRIQLYKNKDKNLKVGYLTKLINTEFGIYNTFYNNILIVNCSINNYVYISNDCIIKNSKIGKFCSIGPNVKIGLGIHPTDHLSTFPAFFSSKKQCQITFCDKTEIVEMGSNTIGNDVWIGANSIVMDNVEVGNGAIIAAGSVVTKDVLPYSIVGGVPAKLIKMRFNESTINKINKMKWWDKDIEWLKTNASKFEFIELWIK